VKELLFSITAADCDWSYERGTGPGGQARNKTESKVRCTHRDSGAVGVSDETRSQHANKKKAFAAMAGTDKFKAWHRVECARHTGALLEMERRVDNAMRPSKIIIDVKDKKRRWVPRTNWDEMEDWHGEESS
jgi:protein subunit release factor A